MTQPTRMPRTQLKFTSGLETPLVPERGEGYYSTPNQMRDYSGVFEAVRRAGPAPYLRSLPGRVAFFLIFGLFGGVFALIGFRFLLSGLSATGSWRDKFEAIDIGFAIIGSIFVCVAAYAISTGVSGSSRPGRMAGSTTIRRWLGSSITAALMSAVPATPAGRSITTTGPL